MKCYRQKRQYDRGGFTLVETVIALFIAGLAISALVGGYVWLARGADAASYALVANGLALQRYEQTRIAKLDAGSYPIVDELTDANFRPQVNVLDMNASGTRIVYATNFTTITTLATNPLLKAIRVDCVYALPRGGVCTSTVVSYRGSETGQQNAQQSAGPAVSNAPPSEGTISVTNSRSGATNAGFGSGAGEGWSQRGNDHHNHGGNNNSINNPWAKFRWPWSRW